VTESLAQFATEWMDRWFDPAIGLLRNPPGSFDAEGVEPLSVHTVQQGGWYAAGLLMRGDEARAAQVINALCDVQYDEPGTAWHGTFRRFHETPPPREGARMWVDYDPNWRQFVGTSFALLLRRFPDAALPVERMRRAIDLAVEGEAAHGRVTASYSNIAVMKAWLDVFAGRVEDGEALGEEIVERFRRHGTLEEYNSPTYYGVVLFALALWRSETESERLRAWGAEIEEGLWRDLARYWHASLRNVAGPYTRSYGMDLEQYASQLSLWVWHELGREAAPFPTVGDDGGFEHSHDLCMGPMVELLGARIPTDVVDVLRTFPGEHTVEQVISDNPLRVATAWLADDVMVGAESSELDWGGWYQYVGATVHWRRPEDGALGWLKVRHKGVVDARAEPGRLVVDCRGESDVVVESSHPLPFPSRWDGPRKLVIEVSREGGPTAAG
jgi:hypothetical protein